MRVFPATVSGWWFPKCVSSVQPMNSIEPMFIEETATHHDGITMIQNVTILDSFKFYIQKKNVIVYKED